MIGYLCPVQVSPMLTCVRDKVRRQQFIRFESRTGMNAMPYKPFDPAADPTIRFQPDPGFPRSWWVLVLSCDFSSVVMSTSISIVYDGMQM